MRQLQGKGLWAYRPWELDEALRLAPAMGITHILYKVGQGPWRGKAGYYISRAAEMAARIRRAGLVPLAWSFTTLGDPQFEAEMVVRAFHDGYEGFVFDAEGSCSHRNAEAEALGHALAAKGVEQERLYLCSFPTPLTLHADIPFNEMGLYCRGGLMPMAYGTYHQPPEVVIDAWTFAENRRWMERQGLHLPIYPVIGPYYDEYGRQRMTAETLQAWLDRLRPFNVSFFSLYTAATMEPSYAAVVKAFPVGATMEPHWVGDLRGAVLYRTAGERSTARRAFIYGTAIQAAEPGIELEGVRWLPVRVGEEDGWMEAGRLVAAEPPPWPPLAPPPIPPDGHLLTVWTITELNVRTQPVISATTLTGRIPEGTRLHIVEETDRAREKLGQVGAWYRVRIEPDGPVVWVAAWYVADSDPHAEVEAGLQVEVDSPIVGYLNIRQRPVIGAPILARIPHGTVLTALEPIGEVMRKLGHPQMWLKVRLPDGQVGFAAAWYLRQHIEPAIEGIHNFIANGPDGRLVLYEAPDGEASWWVSNATIVETLEDDRVAAAKVGQEGLWLHVRTPAHKEGFVRTEHLAIPDDEDRREKVDDARLPFGTSAWLFGMHAASIADDTTEERQRLRSLFAAHGRKGWVLFTEGIGANPDFAFNPTLRTRLWDWARQAGYGVVVRLNYGYHPAGTLPLSEHYEAFAQTCARWVERYLKHDEVQPSYYTWIIQIGNEENNPWEHPGDDGGIREHITPELYAQAFNLTYRVIKAVLPQAIVVPGAIDPYNAQPMPLLGYRRYRPLDYFQAMLEHIDEVDGFVLHAYTHGPSIEAITWLRTFSDPFLADHYFDFQTYRLFLERIPAKWKRRPVLINETNHVCRPDCAPACDRTDCQGWVNANTGWIRALYEEVERWNAQPYAQQVWGVLLYRWMGDRWSLRDKPQTLEDFRQAMIKDRRWRR